MDCQYYMKNKKLLKHCDKHYVSSVIIKKERKKTSGYFEKNISQNKKTRNVSFRMSIINKRTNLGIEVLINDTCITNDYKEIANTLNKQFESDFSEHAGETIHLNHEFDSRKTDAVIKKIDIPWISICFLGVIHTCLKAMTQFTLKS